MKKEKESAIFAVERYVSIAKIKAAYVKKIKDIYSNSSDIKMLPDIH
jgi:hypothetical protein